MRIGIDFDNTIASYDLVFRKIAYQEGYISKEWEGGKKKLRDYLRKLPNGENIWMRIQGQVYGKYMHRAQIIPGIANFLLTCKCRKVPVYVVSHKTEFGHYDPDKIPLRIEAMKWMKAKGFFEPDKYALSKRNVFFASTRSEKVKKITELDCTYFIDDLEEILLEPEFPIKTKRILFCPINDTAENNDFITFNSWMEISRFVFGYETDDDIKTWLDTFVKDEVCTLKQSLGQGNSRLYKVMTTEGKLYALKYYPDQLTDARPRLRTEFRAFQFLHQSNITNVPEAVKKDEDLNLGLYEWIKGDPVTDPTLDNLKQATDFVEKLHILSREIGGDDIELASEACLSAADLISQIEKRFKRLNAVRGNFPELSRFLERTFEPLMEEVKDKSYYLWPIESRDNRLPREGQALSSSDFGFHNALKDGGKITFIDFEYFGWDDPVKLTADFIWHPAMELDSRIATEWENAMLDLFVDDLSFADRLLAAMPLYGLRWAMILLNEFLPGFVERRQNARGANSFDEEKSQSIQLSKARYYCERVRRISSQLTVTS